MMYNIHARRLPVSTLDVENVIIILYNSVENCTF